MTEHDILVRGAGAAGMAAALALSRQGLRVALLGALEEPARADVRAYALNAAAVQLLAGLKVWEAIPADARTAVHDMHVQGDAPGAAIHFSAWQQSLSELAWIVDAAELEQALRAAVRFAPHVTVVAAPVPAALQVLAEGKDSSTRAALGVRMPRHAYGQRAVAARLHTDRPHAGLARQWFRSPDILALLPLDRPVKGHGLALVWSLPDALSDAHMAMDEAEFLLALHAIVLGVERPFTDCLAGIGVQLGQQPVGIGAGFVFGFADDHVDAVTELQAATETGGAGLHVGDGFTHLVHRIGPHQVDVACLGGAFAGFVAEPAEIERRALARNGGDPRRIEVELVELALEIEVFAVQQGAHDLHDLSRTGIARGRRHGFAGHVGRDDVDVEPPAGACSIGAKNPVKRGNAAGQLRRPVFAHSGGPQQLDPLYLGGNGGGKSGGIQTQLIARRQQDIIEPAFFGAHHDIAAMLPARLEIGIGNPQKLVVIVAQCRKPGHFTLLFAHQTNS
ncbi:MAG TPA: FAD-dependent monooxygenase, partial [Alicycliphilus sp.]|nr:FAD-dependent monooxygenase [Alicycliphilus sp.]